MLNQTLPFDAANPAEALRQLPARKAAVFALYGADESAEPYIGTTPDLRRRLERLLRPAVGQTRRLQLVSRVRRIAWQITGSEFESLLLQFCLLEQAYGAKVLERMHLRPPAFVRFHGGNPYPRLTITNRPSLKESQWAFGPFPSRTSAERYCEEVLKLFLLRRCEENLDPHPSHPGCVYSEMKKCLAPCYQGCTDERYAEESDAVRSFLATRGESKLTIIGQQRDHASEQMEFEAAAALHAQFQRVESVRALAAEIVRPLSELRACFFQVSANPEEVSVFLYENGELRGPAPFSTLGMRIQNEQSGSSSLFAQPMAIQPVPESEPQGSPSGTSSTPGTSSQPGRKANRDLLEARLESVLESLAATRPQPNATTRQGHLALVTRWYYRPQQKRIGEICFPHTGENQPWPLKSMLRSIGRVAAASLSPASLSPAGLPPTSL
ncbi:excinuclease ABC subunit UvrC [Acidicapsa ligni]|uniref:excinuclease ABC subunit C n=1 Tax=Acidicapsa ligni TaxID=542300 RepID=UPI0021E05FD5|nr:excinuclease ABC subunit C [Acidicapsa ligni]